MSFKSGFKGLHRVRLSNIRLSRGYHHGAVADRLLFKSENRQAVALHCESKTQYRI